MHHSSLPLLYKYLCLKAGLSRGNLGAPNPLTQERASHTGAASRLLGNEKAVFFIRVVMALTTSFRGF